MASPKKTTDDLISMLGELLERQALDAEVDMMSLAVFQRRHGLSNGAYYELRSRGLGPRETRINDGGGRVKIRITKEAAAEWRAMMQARSAQHHPTQQQGDQTA
jgi:hypothetical protein